MRIAKRENLQIKIMQNYPSLKAFCEDIGKSYAYIYKILNGKSYGSAKFWADIQATLNIPDEKIESFRKIN